MDPSPLRPSDLLEDVLRDLTRQDYGPRPPIDGVVLGEVPVFRSADGAFAETARLDEGGVVHGLAGFRPAQWNWSLLDPGAIKAWHLHLDQEDLFIVPPASSLLIGLADVRRHSPTASAVQRLLLGGGRCHRLLIPRGVAHGVANPGSQPQTILYAVNRHFTPSPEETDEWRLPWDRFGTAFWAMERG